MAIDFRRPIPTLFPGVLGRVLDALCGTTAEMTARQIARVAEASPSQVGRVLGDLVALGVVQRRDAGPSSLHRLAVGNMVSDAILDLHDLRGRLITAMSESIAVVDPAPANVTVFGSFARGTAGPQSDIDVLVVRPDGVDQCDESWERTLHAWANATELLAGNRVEVLELSEADLHDPTTTDGWSLWSDLLAHGEHISGERLSHLVST